MEIFYKLIVGFSVLGALTAFLCIVSILPGQVVGVIALSLAALFIGDILLG